MRPELRFTQQQRLELRLAPQIIQRIEILQLPTLQLEQRIQEELVQNPVLELAEEPTVEPSLEAPPEQPERRGASEFEKLDDIEPMMVDHGSFSSAKAASNTEEDPKFEALQNVPARAESLQDYLFYQFTLLHDGERERRIAENIIYNIDDNGYLEYPLQDILPELDPPVTIEEAEGVLRKVQELDPPGVGARNLAECLLLQLRGSESQYPLEAELIRNHLDDIMNNRIPKICAATNRSVAEIKKAIEFIGTLNPRPGSLISVAPPSTVTPDVVVKYVDGQYEVELTRDYASSVRVNPEYIEMLEKLSRTGGDPKTIEYLKNKLRDARWLIDGIEQRRETLLKIAREILKAQSDFLEKGVEGLKPLKMQTVADHAGVHVSTVSRAISGKYIQTPWGIFDLKFFFMGGLKTDDGEDASQRAVKLAIKEIVDQEDRTNPLVDDQIADILRQRGINIARRTITKYRKALGIPSARRRKQY